MTEDTRSSRSRSSRRQYRDFVRDYRSQRLESTALPPDRKDAEPAARAAERTRREYLRDYVQWLRPHRAAIAVVLTLAFVSAGLQMIEPLFMRFIIDRVLLNEELDAAARLSRLHLAGSAFLGVILAANLLGAVRDYRQRLLNVRVMLSLRRSLFDRLLHLPLPRLWDMKTGGILSRLTGDVDATTGLLQMALVSPAVSVVRLAIALVVLLVMNWRLALTALAIVPGVMVISFVSAKRVRPIYRSFGKTRSRSTAASARRSPASASCVHSAARHASWSSTCAAAIPSSARSCSRTGARWCSGRRGASCWPR